MYSWVETSVEYPFWAYTRVVVVVAAAAAVASAGWAKVGKEGEEKEKKYKKKRPRGKKQMSAWLWETKLSAKPSRQLQ